MWLHSHVLAHMNSLAASRCHIKASHMNSLTASRRHMILHFSLQFFYCKIYWSGCWSSWENLDRLQHRLQPVKFLDSVVPSPCETDNFVLSTGLTMWIGHPKDSISTFRALALRRNESRNCGLCMCEECSCSQNFCN